MAALPDSGADSPRVPKIGLFLPIGEGPPSIGWETTVALAQRAEEVGFDSLWLPDHMLMSRGEDGLLGVWECWSFLSGLATVTSRIELGPLVTSTSYRNPALIAKIAETVDEISGGRLVLGLGAGHVPFEATAFGFPYDRRASRFEEAIQIITGLLHERTVSFDGTFYQARDCELRPAGPRPGGLPVMAGVEGPRMMRLAARHADEINIDIGTTLDTVGPTRDAIDSACRDVGRDPATLRRSAFVLVDLSSDDLPGDPWVAGIFEGRAYIGPPEQLVRVFRAYAAAGFGHVQVWLNPTSVEAINALAPVLGLLHGALSEEGASPALQRGETPHDRSGPAQA